MATDSLPKDPAGAAELLAKLQIKDQKETICRYPTCDKPRKTAVGTGRPSAFCENEAHTPQSNHTARKQLAALASGGSLDVTKSTGAGGVPSTESLRGFIVTHIKQLQTDLEQYLTLVTEIADPDLAAAQIQAATDRAEAQVAEALQSASAERSLRLAAEAARRATQTEAEAEREAAELAMQQAEEANTRVERLQQEHQQQMEEANERIKRLQQEHAQEITEIQAERDESIHRVRLETQQQRDEIEAQAKQAIAEAQAKQAIAEAQVKEAKAEAHDAQTEARSQVVTAERLLSEAHASLERERAEVDRLRKELATTIADARERAEADRAEARANLERERAEVDRLRKELADLRKRTDHLTEVNESLRSQLHQASSKEV